MAATRKNPSRSPAKKSVKKSAKKSAKRAPTKSAVPKRVAARGPALAADVHGPNARTGVGVLPGTVGDEAGPPPPRPAAEPEAVTAPPPDRVVIEEITPVVDGGRFPAKRVVGEPVTVTAAIYAEGHDHLWCVVAHQPPGPVGDADAQGWVVTPMTSLNPGLDQWKGEWTPRAEGLHRFRVLAWIDEIGSWASATTRKLDAGVPVDSELLEGAAILERAADRHDAAGRTAEAEVLRRAAAQLRDGDTSPITDRGGERRPSPAQLVHASLDPATATASVTYDVLVERERALFSSWYELFPRSWGRPGEHGTLADVERQLDYVADMGFDILYLPPIHPIGRSFRKGRNNTEQADADDVGSPWAIGGPEGGHTAMHPALGTVEDLRSLVRACARNGIELALDIAFQCSPDHPWVTEHPAWFRHRPDGTIQYAENPPKKYQDIYPLNFDTADWRNLWDALRDVFTHWMDQGVRVFRVDNPHTKPFAFWEWVIGELRRRDPGVILLSEAFSRPKIMHRLTRVGFTLSYSYFPWRVAKHDLVEYFTELSSPPSVDEFRPSAWPNTPDILPWHLMDAPRAQFAARAFTAATLSPSWGIYGPAFELGASQPAGNGKEEYHDSEKYEVRSWHRHDPASIRSLIAELNRVRTENRALHTLRTLRFHTIENDELLCFSKTAHAGPSADPADPHGATVLVIANLDPHHGQAGTTWLDLPALGVDPERPFDVQDLMTGRRFTWHGPQNYVELWPEAQPGHIFRVTQG
jgi:starch synthase (maltosyl-transferring)